MTRLLKLLCLGLAVITIGFFIGHQVALKKGGQSIQNSSNTFPLLSDRLFVDNPSESVINFSELRKNIKDYYTLNNLSGSIYFEYLPTGTSIRVDGDNKEVAASLAKLPIAMVAYKVSENKQLDLNQEITLKPEWLDSDYGDLYKQGAGFKLTLEDAVKRMLIDSDNTALAAVTSSLEGKVNESDNPFTFMDTDYSQNSDQTVSIGARSYSSFLKCLYYSCYLNEQNSSRILEYLTKSPFDNRLVAGIDPNVVVAHKIGTFGDTTQSDCGIVHRTTKLCTLRND